MARILVIDDDAEIRAIVQETLEVAGHQVRVAEHGRRGLELQRQEAADLVITDIFMPEKEGIETIMELQQEFPGLKIIAISGGGVLGTLDYLPTAAQFGAVHTLSKPFDRDALLALVGATLAS